MPKIILEDRPIWPAAPAEPVRSEPEAGAPSPAADEPPPASAKDAAPPERAG